MVAFFSLFELLFIFKNVTLFRRKALLIELVTQKVKLNQLEKLAAYGYLV